LEYRQGAHLHFRALSPQVVRPTKACNTMPDLELLYELQSATAHLVVPNYIAW